MNACVYNYALACDQTTNPVLVFPQHGASDREAVLDLTHGEQISLQNNNPPLI